ncbi:MAG: hypothetical protein IIA63_02015 [Nitrospinae bacterium]|nr:hypothetical protein [Nitrospinota bacterium]
MNTTDRFSTRHGYSQPEVEITVRNDAPEELRGVVRQIAYETGLSPKPLREIVCRVFRTRPDSNNWSEYPNIDEEVEFLLDSCEWFQVYDTIEEIHNTMGYMQVRPSGELQSEYFSNELNKYFCKAGVGWQLVNGKIEFRGPEIFEQNVRSAIDILISSDRPTASTELHEALSDLSRRPKPDITGAIQHAMGALECVARDVTGNQSSTLGEIIKRNPNLIPKPLDKSVEKAWGYASEMGRHLQEGRVPEIEEAQLIVGLAGALSIYLSKKFTPS